MNDKLLEQPEPIFSEIDTGIQLGFLDAEAKVVKVKGNCQTIQAGLDDFQKLQEWGTDIITGEVIYGEMVDIIGGLGDG